jgi:hypothetical protein
MSWIEADGPPVAKPRQRGFGHRIAETMVATAVAGSVTLDYAPTDVRWTLRSAPPAEPPHAPVTDSNAILIVEDNTLLAFDLAETLRRAGYDIIGPAASVATALGLLQKTRPFWPCSTSTWALRHPSRWRTACASWASRF